MLKRSGTQLQGKQCSQSGVLQTEPTSHRVHLQKKLLKEHWYNARLFGKYAHIHTEPPNVSARVIRCVTGKQSA